MWGYERGNGLASLWATGFLGGHEKPATANPTIWFLRRSVSGLAKRRGLEAIERRNMPEELTGFRKIFRLRHRRRGHPGFRGRPLQIHAGRDFPRADRR
jgi:hypothetical protein